MLLPLPPLGALALAFLADGQLRAGRFATGALVAAGCLFVCLLFSGTHYRHWRRRWRDWLATAVLALAGTAVFGGLAIAGSRYGFYGTLLALYLAFVYRIDQRRGAAAPEPAPLSLPNWLENALLCLIFLLGLFLRVAFLDRYPAGLYIDEAHSGHMAMDIASQCYRWGDFHWPPVFITWGGGRCGFPFWITALWVKALGASETALRLDAVSFAVMTVLAFWYLLRQLVDRTTALLGTVLFAASRWHLTFSPLAWGTPPMLLFACLGFGALLSGLQRNRPVTLFLGGLSLAAAVNTYASARFLGVVFVLFIAGHLLWAGRRSWGPWRGWWKDKLVLTVTLLLSVTSFYLASMLLRGRLYGPQQMGSWTLLLSILAGLAATAVAAQLLAAWRPWRHALAACLGFYLGMMPLAHYGLEHRGRVNERAGQVFAWGPQYPGGIPKETVARAVENSENPTLTRLRLYSGPVWRHTKAVLAMFHYKGDFIGRHNLPDAPAFGRVEGALLILGLSILLARLGSMLTLTLLPWFLVPVLATAFFEPAPHMLRSLPALPAALGIATVGLAVPWSLARRYWGAWGAAPVGVVLAALVAYGAYQSAHLFTAVQIHNPAVIGGFSPPEIASAEYMTRYMNTDPPHIVVSTPYPYNTASIKFLAYDRYPEILPWNSGILPFVGDGTRPIVFFLEDAYDNVIPLIRHYFPEGTLVDVRDRVGQGMGKAYHVAAEAYQRRLGLVLTYLDAAGRPLDGTRVALPEELAAPLPAGATGATLVGMLKIERQSSYRFRLAGGSDARLRVNLVAVSPDDDVALFPGAQAVEIEVGSSPAGPLRLQWQRPDAPGWAAVPRDRLFAVEPPGGGLLMKLFLGNQWLGDPIVLRREMLIQAPSLPIAPFSVEWSGFIHVPTGGMVGFRICSDDGSFLWIDNQLWIDNGGNHGRECREAMRPLSAGRHALKVRYFQDGGAQTMELYWLVSGKPWAMVPAAAFSPPEP